ncbi:unnamed protein product [Pocillopora meandrina]|uniref:G-protein coupled receptors family 1 profile domain-containing protein n=1 Tax=Pocillopora meandrina TaxID=46732 RepID=A0AAU9XB33_9CNID|nr:unnamed protein product [Pocillopora meandrina]
MCSAFVSSSILWKSRGTRDFIVSVSVAFGFIITFVVYIRIYLTIRRHKNQIYSLQVQEVAQSNDMKKFVVLVKSTLNLRRLRTSVIVNCVFNIFLSYTAIMLNIVTMYAMRKTLTLPTTLKTLLLSLTVSDAGVGLFVQPFYTFFLSKWLKLDDPSCVAYHVRTISGYLLTTASFLGVVAVSVDRSSIAQVLLSSVNLAIGFIITCVVYIRIYLTVRRHKNQMQSVRVLEEAQSDEIAYFSALTKSTVGVFYVYLVFLGCYMPFFICLVLVRIYGSSIALKHFYLWSQTLIYINSSLNPVIYCWKMRHVRHAIMDILRNMTRKRNHPSRVLYSRSSNAVRFCRMSPLILTLEIFEKLSLSTVSSKNFLVYRYHVEHCDDMRDAKTSFWPKTLKTLLLSLAVSDFGLGLFAQAIYTFPLVNWLKLVSKLQRIPSICSFHLRYQELVTHKRVVVVVISIWVYTIIFILTFVMQIRIYLTVRRHKNQIQSTQVQAEVQCREATNFSFLIKSTDGVYYLYLVFLVMRIYGSSTFTFSQ